MITITRSQTAYLATLILYGLFTIHANEKPLSILNDVQAALGAKTREAYLPEKYFDGGGILNLCVAMVSRLGVPPVFAFHLFPSLLPFVTAAIALPLILRAFVLRFSSLHNNRMKGIHIARGRHYRRGTQWAGRCP